jgi:hypothetical protein
MKPVEFSSHQNAKKHFGSHNQVINYLDEGAYEDRWRIVFLLPKHRTMEKVQKPSVSVWIIIVDWEEVAKENAAFFNGTSFMYVIVVDRMSYLGWIRYSNITCSVRGICCFQATALELPHSFLLMCFYALFWLHREVKLRTMIKHRLRCLHTTIQSMLKLCHISYGGNGFVFRLINTLKFLCFSVSNVFC